MGRRSLVLSLVLALVLVVVGATGARLSYVHAHTWAWSVFAPEAPPKVEFGGRVYHSADGPGRLPLPANAVVAGETMGGAPIYQAPSDGSTHPTLIWVVDSTDRTWSYGLAGGP
jgi:hypothetical protein